MKAKIRLGELLIAKNLASKEQIDEALHLQASGKRRLGYLLISMGIITEEQLLNILSEQLEFPIIDVNEEYKPEVKRLVPRYLCRKYNVLPLDTENNNILSLAMADPLDDEAITTLENYTGMVVKPKLTLHKNISSAITHNIPFTFNEISHYLTLNYVVKFVSAFAIVMMLSTSVFVGRYIYQEIYGTTSRTNDSIVYKNHDLMLGLDPTGKITLLGRAARSEGYYSVSFAKPETLRAFIERKKSDFSGKQEDWLKWIIENRIDKSLAKNG